MKRFISDLLLILFMVGIGSGLMKPSSSNEVVDYSIADFERKIQQHEVIGSKDGSTTVLHIDGNKASDLALSCSLAIEEGTRIVVEFVTSLFSCVVN